MYHIHTLKSFVFKLRSHTRSAKLDQVGVRGLSFTRFFGRLGDTAGGVELGRCLYHKYSPAHVYIEKLTYRRLTDIHQANQHNFTSNILVT